MWIEICDLGGALSRRQDIGGWQYIVSGTGWTMISGDRAIGRLCMVIGTLNA